MKKKLIFLLALFLSAAQFAGAQCYLLNDSQVYTLHTIEISKAFE